VTRPHQLNPIGLVLVFGALVACAHSNNAKGVRAAADAAAVRVKEIRAGFASKKFYPTCGEPHPTGSQCGLLVSAYWAPEQIEHHFATACAGETEELCRVQLRFNWYQLLFDRYALGVLRGGPVIVCAPEECPDPRTEELSILSDHNASIAEQEQLAVSAIELENIRAEKELEIAAGRRQRAAAERLRRAPSTGLQQGGCASDFECGSGRACVKDSFALRGVCATTVNSYGTPTFSPPNLNSVGPGTGSCSFDTQCGIGFRCVKTSGGLLGNCLR
jgi:hypothetical protein